MTTRIQIEIETVSGSKTTCTVDDEANARQVAAAFSRGQSAGIDGPDAFVWFNAQHVARVSFVKPKS